jgi:hypothetical protein
MALTIDGSDPTGDLGDLLDAKLDLAGGKILQIVRATDATNRTTTSTSFVDASISVTITPQKSDSAVLIWALGRCNTSGPNNSNQLGILRITDNSNNAISGAQNVSFGGFQQTHSSGQIFDGYSIVAYSTPATTSAVTYKLRFSCSGASSEISIDNVGATGQMYAIEVSA